MRIFDALSTFIQELRVAARSLAKSPGYAVVAILTLALGIGANTAIFSLIDGVLLARSPYSAAEELVALRRSLPSSPREGFAPADLFALREQSSSLAAVAAWDAGSTNLTGDGEPERLQATQVSGNFFSTLGVRPQLGVLLTEADEAPGAEPTVVLSNALWQRRFAGDPGIVGQQLTLAGVQRTVIGVLPGEFRFQPAGSTEVFTTPVHGVPAPPFDLPPGEDVRELRGLNYFRLIGRLAPGIGLERSASELASIGERWAVEYPDFYAQQTLALAELREEMIGELQRPLWTLMGAVAAVLLIACLNVAGLALARLLGRRREIALRAALGAGRAELARTAVTEGLLLALAGGGLGLLVAVWGRDTLLALAPTALVGAGSFTLDGGVLLFALAAVLVSLLLSSAVPALLSTRPQIEQSLRQGDGGVGGRGTGGRGAGRLRAGLVVAETALALVLLVGAGLLVRSLISLTSVDPGLDPEGVLALTVNLPATTYAEESDTAAYFDRARERIGALPGVEVVSQVFNVPFSGGEAILNVAFEGQPLADPGELPEAGYQVVGPGYFEALRIPVLRGTALPAAADLDSPAVAVVSQALVDRYLADVDPIGRRLTFNDPAVAEEDDWVTIVGVVADVRHRGFDAPGRAEVYLSSRQDAWSSSTLLVRASGDPLTLAEPVRRVLYEIDPDVPAYRVQPLAGYVSGSVADRRFLTLLLGFFAAVAVSLAALGIYGVVAYSVAQRRREIGIRMALGARRERVVRGVVGGGLRLALAGLVLGGLAALGLTRLLAGFLFGIGRADPASFAAGGALLVVAAAAACWLPARRAAAVDPAVTLRSD